MHILRGIFDTEMAIRKLFSRFRRPLRVSRSEWPVISVTRPLFYLLRFFGLAPFGISGDDFIPGSYNVIYSLFCIIVQTYAAYLVLDRFASVRRGKLILDITETAKVIFNYSVALLNILVAVWTRKDFIGILNIVKHFDSKLRDLGHPRKEGAAKVWVWSTVLCIAFLWITISRISMLAFSEPWTENISYLLNYLATSLSTIKFSSIVLLLGQRFRDLNMVAQHKRDRTTKTKQMNITIDFKVIQQLHNSLMNAGESLNSQYSWPLLLWVINLSVHSVNTIYFMIVWLVMTPVHWADNESQLAFVICITSWLISFLGQLLLLHGACHFTSTEANNLGSIIINWKSLAVSRNYKVESLLHLINRKLNFSAAGCFYVNLPLLRSIAALLTTYLILLLQFED